MKQWATHLKGSDRRERRERKKDEGEMEGKKRERRCLARESDQQQTADWSAGQKAFVLF